MDKRTDSHELGYGHCIGFESGGSLAGFLSKHLNVEIGMALRSDNWAAKFQSEPLPTFLLTSY